MNDIDCLVDSIAFCGLICSLCFLAEKCDGCKSARNDCERNCSDEGCFQKKCCEEKAFEGCWECQDLYACEKGIYSSGSMSKIKAFAICIREDGKRNFIEHIVTNMAHGLSVEKGRDYDNRTTEEVLRMIRASGSSARRTE